MSKPIYKWYTVYDPETLDNPYRQQFEEGMQPPNSTEATIVEQWARPRYNPETDTFYNDATVEEQEQFLYHLKVDEWKNSTYVFDDGLTDPQSSESLNERFPYVQPGFRFEVAKIINSKGKPGVIYTKRPDNIWRVSDTSTI